MRALGVGRRCFRENGFLQQDRQLRPVRVIVERGTRPKREVVDGEFEHHRSKEGLIEWHRHSDGVGETQRGKEDGK